MALPVVAIVGRPNVGKSSLLNAFAGRRISIVDPTPGVTRDRVSAIIDVNDVYFELVDTGGYGIEDRDRLTEHVEQQIRYAVESASLVLFVVDLQAELTRLDQQVAEFLRPRTDHVLLVANKADTLQHEREAGRLIRLGFGDPRCVSALHGRETRSLLEEIAARVGVRGAAPNDPVLKLAIVGRQNVGKSTFINGLARAPRVIVSETPGTTRDAIDVRIEHQGRTLLLIDTAGIRKRAARDKTGIDFYSVVRAEQSIRRADVVLFMIDATAKITDVDKKLAGSLVEQFKPVAIVVNKWDLAKGRASADDYGDYLAKTLPGLSHAPIAFTSATQERNLASTLDLAHTLHKQADTRVTTGQLNRAIQLAVEQRQPTSDRKGRQPRIYYATQVATCPPTIVVFVNNPTFMREDYRRFLVKRFRDALPFPEVPIRLLWRARRSAAAAGSRPTRHR